MTVARAVRTGGRRPGPDSASSRVPVPCCQCGQPTALRVPPSMLEELDILHLCAACYRTGPTPVMEEE